MLCQSTLENNIHKRNGRYLDSLGDFHGTCDFFRRTSAIDLRYELM